MTTPLQEFLQCKTIALAGASRSGKKFGAFALKELKTRGYEILPLHPEQGTVIEGTQTYPSLSSLPSVPDGLLVIVPPARGEALLKEAADKGIRRVWLQPGSESPALLKLGASLDLRVVSGCCILMYMPPVRSFHSVHRFFVRLFGRLQPS